MTRALKPRPALLALLLAMLPCSAVMADYKDPLDTPSSKSPVAARTQLQGIAYAGDRLVAVGWRGHIVYSDDQGNSWIQASVPVDIDLTALSFASQQQGWAVGHGGVILHTEDGGKTWSKQLDGRSAAAVMLAHYEERLQQGDEEAAKYVEDVKLNTEGGPEQPWLDVSFEDELHGYVVGTFGQIMYTSDGGKNWVPQLELVDNPEALHLTAIARANGAVYIASERGTIFVKDAGSQRFRALETGYRGTFFGILASARTILAYGLQGSVYRSTDQGANWSRLYSGVNTSITGGQLAVGQPPLLVSQGGQLLMIKAMDDSLQQLPVKQPAMFTGIARTHQGKVVVIGTAGANLESVKD